MKRDDFEKVLSMYIKKFPDKNDDDLTAMLKGMGFHDKKTIAGFISRARETSGVQSPVITPTKPEVTKPLEPIPEPIPEPEALLSSFNDTYSAYDNISKGYRYSTDEAREYLTKLGYEPEEIESAIMMAQDNGIIDNAKGIPLNNKTNITIQQQQEAREDAIKSIIDEFGSQYKTPEEAREAAGKMLTSATVHGISTEDLIKNPELAQTKFDSRYSTAKFTDGNKSGTILGTAENGDLIVRYDDKTVGTFKKNDFETGVLSGKTTLMSSTGVNIGSGLKEQYDTYKETLGIIPEGNEKQSGLTEAVMSGEGNQYMLEAITESRDAVAVDFIKAHPDLKLDANNPEDVSRASMMVANDIDSREMSMGDLQREYQQQARVIQQQQETREDAIKSIIDEFGSQYKTPEEAREAAERKLTSATLHGISTEDLIKNPELAQTKFDSRYSTAKFTDGNKSGTILGTAENGDLIVRYDDKTVGTFKKNDFETGVLSGKTTLMSSTGVNIGSGLKEQYDTYKETLGIIPEGNGKQSGLAEAVMSGGGNQYMQTAITESRDAVAVDFIKAHPGLKLDANNPEDVSRASMMVASDIDSREMSMGDLQREYISRTTAVDKITESIGSQYKTPEEAREAAERKLTSATLHGISTEDLIKNPELAQTKFDSRYSTAKFTDGNKSGTILGTAENGDLIVRYDDKTIGTFKKNDFETGVLSGKTTLMSSTGVNIGSGLKEQYDTYSSTLDKLPRNNGATQEELAKKVMAGAGNEYILDAINASRDEVAKDFIKAHPELHLDANNPEDISRASMMVASEIDSRDMSMSDLQRDYRERATIIENDLSFRTNEDGSIQFTYKDENGNIVKGEGSFFENYERGLSSDEKAIHEKAKAALGKDKNKYTNSKDSLLSDNTKLWNNVLNGKNKKSQAEFERNLGIIEKNISDINSQSAYWQGIAKNSGLEIALANVQAEINQLKQDNLTLKDVATKADRLKQVTADLVKLNDKKNALQDEMKGLEAEVASLGPRPTPHYEYERDSNGILHEYGPTNLDKINEWDTKKKELDKKIADNKDAQDAIDKDAEPLKNEEKELSDVCNKYSNVIKLALAIPTKGSSPPGGPPPGGDGDPDKPKKTEPPTTPDLHDTTEDQLKIYEQLTAEQLELIARALQEFADTNNLTVDALLLDTANSEKLINLLLEIDGIPEDLKTLIKGGDREATQRLLNSVFNGERSNIVGLNESAVDTLHTYLNNVAQSRGLTLDQLINDEKNSELLKTSLQGYGDVPGQFKELTSAAVRDEVMAINDGDGIDSLSDGQITIVREYTASQAGRRNMSIEDYCDSNTLVDDFSALSKSSILMNNLSHYSSGKLSETLTKLLLRNSE